MHKLKLTYFDIDGGRAEPARLAMHVGRIPFEDDRFTFAQFAEIKKAMPLAQVPVLTIDGLQVTQCNAINRFVGKLAGLYPRDPFQALLCDEILEAVEDVDNRIGPTLGMQGEEFKRARKALVDETFPRYLKFLQARLLARGGDFFIENRLSMADLKVFCLIRWLNSGLLDHVPTTLVETLAPELNRHCQRIAQVPEIAEYYAGRAE